jgi:hypothetical protein
MTSGGLARRALRVVTVRAAAQDSLPHIMFVSSEAVGLTFALCVSAQRPSWKGLAEAAEELNHYSYQLAGYDQDLDPPRGRGPGRPPTQCPRFAFGRWVRGRIVWPHHHHLLSGASRPRGAGSRAIAGVAVTRPRITVCVPTLVDVRSCLPSSCPDPRTWGRPPPGGRDGVVRSSAPGG